MLLLIVTGAAPAWTAEQSKPNPFIIGTYDLPAAKVGVTLNSKLPMTIANDRAISIGGLSDLWRAENDPAGEFWSITDRAPNASVTVDGQKRHTFPVPEYTPLILHLKIDGDRLKLLQTIPLVGNSGKPVTGLPNLTGYDLPGYDFQGLRQLPYNINGLDTEGLVRGADGSFWIAEEYRPSLAKIDASGKVIKRFIPAGEELPGADYDVAPVLPAVYAKRQDNRGFEGLTISNDSKTLFAGLQSPLENPNKKTAEASRNTRILAFDTVTERPMAEYIYRFDVATEVEPDAKPKDMKIGAMAVTKSGRMLVIERTDKAARIYSVDFTAATNILDTPHSAASGKKAIEDINDLTSIGITPLPKTMVADLSKLDGIPEKLEGLAIVDSQTIAVMNDNDFGFKGFDKSGIAIPTGVKTQLVLIRLPKPLP